MLIICIITSIQSLLPKSSYGKYLRKNRCLMRSNTDVGPLACAFAKFRVASCRSFCSLTIIVYVSLIGPVNGKYLPVKAKSSPLTCL